jgi:hypothetical protein
VDFDYRLPDTDEPVITVRRTALGRILVFADAVRVPGRAGVHEVRAADGQAHKLKVVGAWTGLRVIADGWDTPLEPPVPLWARALVLLPLSLVVGGLVGATFGAIGVAVNSVIGRSSMPSGPRAVAMIVVLALGVAGWVGAGIALTGLAPARVSYATGTCLEGISASTDLVSHAPASVACGTAHDGEVVGTFDAADGAYPGETGLRDDAARQCPPLFASYVEIDFKASTLDILPLVPTQVAWQAGTREVSCVALTTDGSKLTGSVKGTAK